MATSMEADSEVLFKEKREGKGVKTETAVDDATLVEGDVTLSKQQ